MDQKAWDLWQLVREQNPLVQCITNFVSMVSKGTKVLIKCPPDRTGSRCQDCMYRISWRMYCWQQEPAQPW